MLTCYRSSQLLFFGAISLQFEKHIPPATDLIQSQAQIKHEGSKSQISHFGNDKALSDPRLTHHT